MLIIVNVCLLFLVLMLKWLLFFKVILFLIYFIVGVGLLLMFVFNKILLLFLIIFGNDGLLVNIGGMGFFMILSLVL